MAGGWTSLPVFKPFGRLGSVPEAPPTAAAVYDLETLLEAATQLVTVTCAAYLGGVLQAQLSVVDGSITADARRTKLRDGSLTFAPTLTRDAEALYELLVTPGLELQLHRGLVDPDGASYLAALGRFVVDEVTWAREQGSSVAATVSDLSARISRARWTDPYQIAAGTALADALKELLADRWPDVITDISCPETLGAQAVLEAGADSDPWADACAIAEAHGYALYFDPEGIARLRSLPDAAQSSPVYTFRYGAGAIIVASTRTSPLERTYNGVIAQGEGSDLEVPVRGEAWDEDAASPTYRYGPFGQVPRYYSSPLITTEGQAESAAASLLAKTLGRVEQLSWTQIPHPGLQPLDVVGVEMADHTTSRHILDELTIPLSASGSESATAREITVSY